METPDGGTALVLLGVRPLGATVAFSPLGRETFLTAVDWVDGWPQPEPVELRPRPGVEEQVFDFADSAALDDPGWLAVRTPPAEVASVDGRPARRSPATAAPSPTATRAGSAVGSGTSPPTVSTRVDASAGTGGLAARYDEQHWFALEARSDDGGDHGDGPGPRRRDGPGVDGRPAGRRGRAPRRDGTAARPGSSAESLGGDRIRLVARAGGEEVLLTELDGRFWTAETCTSFTGRVLGLYATEGTVRFADYRYRGSESGDQHRPGEVGA